MWEPFITRAVKPVPSGGGYKAPRLLCSKLRKIRCIISTMRTYKYKLLSAKRNKKLHRQINAGALAWNHCVAFTRRFYRFYGKSVSENALKKHLTKLKKRVPYGYLRDMGSQALQDVVERLYRSYKRFFDAKKNGEKCGLPGFKKVRKYKSFTLKQTGYKLLDGNELVICGQKYKYFKS